MSTKTVKFSVESDEQTCGFRKFDKVKESGLDWPVHCTQLPRKSICDAEDRPGVYILLDFTHGHLICYVGQTGDRRGSPGSLRKRLKAHDRQRPWWTHVIYFFGDDFVDIDLRKWIESKLFVLAQKNFSVVSTADSLAKLSEPRDGKQILRQILFYCAILGLPLGVVPPEDSYPRLKTIALLEHDLPSGTTDNTAQPSQSHSPSKSLVLRGPFSTQKDLCKALSKWSGININIGTLSNTLRGICPGTYIRPILEQATGISFSNGRYVGPPWKTIVIPSKEYH